MIADLLIEQTRALSERRTNTQLVELVADIARTSSAPEAPIDPFLLSDEDLLVDAFRDGDSYRLLAQMAIHQLHQVTADHERLQCRYLRLLGSYRALRTSVGR